MWVVRGVYRRRLVDIEKGSSLDGDGDGRRARLCLLGTLSSAVGGVTFYRKYQIVGKDGTSIVGCVVRNPFPGCCLPCWALAEESVAYTMSTHHLRQFSASIVGSKLTGTATVMASSPCHSSIADPRTPVYTPTPLSTTIHPYPLSPTTPWLTTHTSTIGPEWQKKRNSGRGLMRSLDGKTLGRAQQGGSETLFYPPPIA